MERADQDIATLGVAKSFFFFSQTPSKYEQNQKKKKHAKNSEEDVDLL